jgi:hypothetical protein
MVTRLRLTAAKPMLTRWPPSAAPTTMTSRATSMTLHLSSCEVFERKCELHCEIMSFDEHNCNVNTDGKVQIEVNREIWHAKEQLCEPTRIETVSLHVLCLFHF